MVGGFMSPLEKGDKEGLNFKINLPNPLLQEGILYFKALELQLNAYFCKIQTKRIIPIGTTKEWNRGILLF